MTAPATKESLKNLHAEHLHWLNELDLCNNELDFFKKSLGEVATKNNNNDLLREVEHFQNQFILQKEKSDELRHEVKASQTALINQVKENDVAWEHQSRPSEQTLREQVNTFRKIFSGLKNEYHAFLSRVL